ncbi:SET and MYND domain-containing protein 3 [Podila epicladia]|nr:SET and MYND domain-containing protein 3 [Podila epicladia]KAG0097850.1 SET and MYND domain-containing protein 3 [Podila epicladia]
MPLPQDSHGDIQANASSPSFSKTSGTKPKRNYRIKARDMDSDSDTTPEPTLQNLSNDTTTATTSLKKPSLPYVESQNAQNLGEVYPGLARLSFLDQADQEIDERQQHETLQRTSRAQSSSQKSHEPLAPEGGSTLDAQGNMGPAPPAPASSAPVPILTPPSVLFAGSPTSLVAIQDTGSSSKGRGLFSAAKETLKPGTLLFKELGYCQVVNDASLAQVCSACFKDTREEQGEDDKASAGLPNGGQRKLTCQIKDWKLHHQLECQGIQKSLANTATKDVWTKHTMDTTSVRAICRLVRRRERVRASAKYKADHGKVDPQQKQVNEVYVSGLDQREEEWLDNHGADWIEQHLNTYEHEPPETTSSSSAKGMVDESSHLTKVMAVVMSCVVSPKENRQNFLKGSGAEETSSGASGFDLIRKLKAYGFSMTNLETTTMVGLGLYIQSMAFMNHSCVPNCVYIFKGPKVECRVIRDVHPGEEMTISYIDQVGTTKERQRQLKEQYHFVCECPLCHYLPANPLIPVKDDTLKEMSDVPLPKPAMDPKQGFVCSNSACGSRTILATEAQLSIYNKIQAQCKECNHTTELDQELVQENQEDADRLVAGFVREMNKGSSSIAKTNTRNFELAKARVSSETQDQGAEKPVIGGMKTVQEPSAQALRYFKEAYKTLTGLTPRLDSRVDGDALKLSSNIEEDTLVRRSVLHHTVRQLEQTGFDEAVSQKNWVFALQRSIELESTLKQVYVGHHPLKSIQSYYTCKIANLLANLLLEESTVEIEESDQDKGSNSDDIDDDPANSDDERDLKALRAAMGVGSGSMQEQLMRKKRRESESAEDKELKKAKLDAKKDKKRVQEQPSSELMKYLKALVPKIEDPQILQEFRVCWGKDGKLASRYRYQVDSLKTALHYAEQPFVQK